MRYTRVLDQREGEKHQLCGEAHTHHCTRCSLGSRTLHSACLFPSFHLILLQKKAVNCYSRGFFYFVFYFLRVDQVVFFTFTLISRASLSAASESNPRRRKREKNLLSSLHLPPSTRRLCPPSMTKLCPVRQSGASDAKQSSAARRSVIEPLRQRGALTASAAPGGLTLCQQTHPKKTEREPREEGRNQITSELQGVTASPL